MKIIECNIKKYSTDQTIDHYEICNRHILAFGKNIQKRISDLTVGVVSVGGLGMVLIEQLMRLFPQKLIFIDKDEVEYSNLNRLVGANKDDVKRKRKKTEIANRLIQNFNPNQEIESIHGDFLDRQNQERFKICDLIIGASDSNAVRIATNRLSLAHGIIYLDCGVGAIVQNGQLTAAGGQIIRVLPDSGFCLHCSGMFNVKEAMNKFLSKKERTRQEKLGYIRGVDIAAPQVYSLNMMVAAWAIWIFKRIVAGENLDFDGLAINAKDFKTYTWNEPKINQNDCPTCGENGIVFQGDDADLLHRDNDESEYFPRINLNRGSYEDATNKENIFENIFNNNFVIGDSRNSQFPSEFVGYM